ncbi:hypothetical protein [Dyadobacter sp. 3J3]|uniref:hypothetical protein n=1 Tax=Dyadobacter sp. 3J3 TaxID=2606600 RepID=UPI00135951A6|nr:hypothetical protein [Dyadobacter sp. 3J3]
MSTTNEKLFINLSLQESLVKNDEGKVIGTIRRLFSKDEKICEIFTARNSQFRNIDTAELLNSNLNLLRDVGLDQRKKTADVCHNRYYFFSLFGYKWLYSFKFWK